MPLSRFHNIYCPLHNLFACPFQILYLTLYDNWNHNSTENLKPIYFIFCLLHQFYSTEFNIYISMVIIISNLNWYIQIFAHLRRGFDYFKQMIIQVQKKIKGPTISILNNTKTVSIKWIIHLLFYKKGYPVSRIQQCHHIDFFSII